MKQYSKLFSLVALLGATSNIVHAMSSTTNNNNNSNRVIPFIQWRSQGRDEARKLYGTTSWAVYQPDMDSCYGTFNVTVQYDQSFRRNEITRALFGPAVVSNPTTTSTTTTTTNNNNCNNNCSDDVIVISGLQSTAVSPATTRAATDLMAENFLLPRDFRSVISFSPKVQDVVVDFNLFVGLDRWVNGLYFRLYGPVAWNRATLRPEENVVNKGTVGYAQGYFDVYTSVPTSALFTQALSYFGGCAFPDDYPTTADAVDVTVQPLMFAKFSDCPTTSTNTTTNNNCNNDCNSSRRHKTGFAELRGEFGYNYIQENYRFLINLQAAAPTGSKIKAEYLFPAYVGNGHHWELGIGLGGAWRMWSSEDAEKSFNFIVEADITHLFNAKQQRTFDLQCKPLSRYMLAEQLLPIPAANADFQLSPNQPVFQAFDSSLGATNPGISGTYAPVANFSTRDVKVSIGVQGDLVAMFNYTCRGFSWDLGYNFWAMSSSKIKLSDNCDDSCGVIPFPTNFALKGDASVGGYNPSDASALVYGLAATETGTTASAGATIFTGVNAGTTNANIDNPIPAIAANPTGATPPVSDPLYAFNATVTTTAIQTSNPPVFISIDDLDIAGARQRGLSNKVFTHLSYTWRDCSDRWEPYVGAGASAEFGSHSGNGDCNNTTTTANCDTCPSSLSIALSKWAIEVKGGVSFH